MKAKTLTQAYIDAGFRNKNPINQWSAIKDDESGVAITIWDDQIDRTSEPWIMDTAAGRPIEQWGHRVGNSVRKKHLRISLDSCGGRLTLILIEAKDPQIEPRSIASREYWPDYIGVLKEEDFDENSGAFKIEIIPVN